MWAEEPGRQEVDSPSEELRQLGLKGDEAQADRSFRLKLDQDVEITFGPELVPEGGAENGQTVNSITAADGRNARLING